MNTQRALDDLRACGALLEGHFRLTSGRHSNRYMQCARMFQFPEMAVKFCRDIVEQLRDTPVDLVIGPAIGGIVMSYEVARQLGVPSLFAERQEGAMTLRRNFVIPPEASVLVVEDTVTTGGSVREVIDIVRQCDAHVAAVGAIVDRSAGKVDFGVPLFAALSLPVESWEADDCPLCQAGLPVVKPGSREVK